MNAHVMKRVALAVCWLGCVSVLGAEESRPFVWKLGDDAAPSYLMGSIHVAREGIYPLAKSIEAAFESCDHLVVEADLEAMSMVEMQRAIAKFAYFTDDRKLQDVIDEKTMDELTEIFASYNMSPLRFERMKPWYVAQVISVLELSRLGVDPQRGIDFYFLHKAREHKQILELEGAYFQLMFLNHFTDDEQRLMLEYSLRDLERTEEDFDEIFAAWQAGDPDRFNRLFTGFLEENAGLEEAFDKLIAGRNLPMFRKIRGLLAGRGSYFIVVGAGHLVGERGLLKMLADDGIPVEQLEGEPAMATAE